jgi:murein DD-endopeptidase MepM/ murein hydrolase activator NlpD
MSFAAKQGATTIAGVLGGPVFEDGGESFESAIGVVSAAQISPAASDLEVAGFLILSEAAIQNLENPLSGILRMRDGLMIYKVQKGDTISKIAANFGISQDTLRWANDNTKNKTLREGEELIILPVSGILHRVEPGETPESIAALYGVSLEAILSINKKFEIGANIIVPGGKPLKGIVYNASKLPDLGNYFMKPASGWNWGRLHEINAVDIANVCGTPIFAAAEGLVEEIGSPEGWNGGYGGYVKIKHPVAANIYTVYAHTAENLVKEGDYVARGDLIAKIGRSGNVHGPTGCHLHFEVHGAKNPFAK